MLLEGVFLGAKHGVRVMKGCCPEGGPSGSIINTSSIAGIVGAGGIGATLNTAFDRYEFDSAAAILLVIIGIVMLAEYTSGYIRGKLA